MTDTPQPCSVCGEDLQANATLQEEIEHLHSIVKQYETSITTHRKLMLTQIEELAKLRS
jgi:transcription initiation factor IIE alpha subunit